MKGEAQTVPHNTILITTGKKQKLHHPTKEKLIKLGIKERQYNC